MARSSYIYIVMDSLRSVDSAFTVKHEMDAYLERGDGPVGQYTVLRVNDGTDRVVIIRNKWKRA